jgi:hypothetical protein
MRKFSRVSCWKKSTGKADVNAKVAVSERVCENGRMMKLARY